MHLHIPLLNILLILYFILHQQEKEWTQTESSDLEIELARWVLAVILMIYCIGYEKLFKQVEQHAIHMYLTHSIFHSLKKVPVPGPPPLSMYYHTLTLTSFEFFYVRCTRQSGLKSKKKCNSCLNWVHTSEIYLLLLMDSEISHTSLKSKLAKWASPELKTLYSESSLPGDFKKDLEKGVASYATFKKFHQKNRQLIESVRFELGSPAWESNMLTTRPRIYYCSLRKFFIVFKTKWC